MDYLEALFVEVAFVPIRGYYDSNIISETVTGKKGSIQQKTHVFKQLIIRGLITGIIMKKTLTRIALTAKIRPNQHNVFAILMQWIHELPSIR